MKNNFAACTVEISGAGRELQLLPSGEFVARDGRPGTGKSWRIDTALAAKLIAQAGARKTPYVIDYEHQTLNSEHNGRPAPAAGWFKTLAWREGAGLFATDVQWTEKARAMIAAGEYRFISPVFSYDAQGRVTGLHMAALTNNPALDGMAQLAAAKFTPQDKEQGMNEELKKLLGLQGDPGDEEIAAATAALCARLVEQEQSIAALKSAAHDPAKFVPVATVEEIRQELAALKAQAQQRGVDELVGAALADGRLLPAMEPWARELGKKDLAALKAYTEQAQPIAALSGMQTQGKAPDARAVKLTSDELAVCKQLGIAESDFLKLKEEDK
ncbi:phage protease [Geoalkalibacter halelectricus]|uniref:phage protease n=1 Tax=Geoalkalibacter halelectricus TaxID=2847045 RepID=UPI003D1B8604